MFGHFCILTRFRNIGREDGRLSKRQLATAYRGYHGLESQYYALLQMSNHAMMQTQTKNEHVQQRHLGEMKSLNEKEKIAEGHASREIRAMREDFRAQLAYQYVYKNHSFRKYDKANQNQKKKQRPVSDKPDLYEQVRKNSATPRPLGSLRQIEVYKDELKKIDLPPINDKQIERRKKINMLGDNSYEKIKENNKDSHTNKDNVTKHMSFPNIETAMGVEVKFRQKISRDEVPDKDSLYSAPVGGMDDAKTDVGSDGPAHVVAFDMGQNLMLMRKREQEHYERHRLLPAPPPSREETRKEGWRRVLPPTPAPSGRSLLSERTSVVFPNNTKNSIGMKKFLAREATEVISTMTSTARRLEHVDKVKELDRTRREINPLPVFDSKRSTSAIIRDFEAYRKYQDDMVIRGQNEADNPIIIRQLSPKPRPESPLSQRRSEYSRLTTPASKHRTLPDGQLKRTDSEVIPSVSRTTSYKHVPDDQVVPHENALLTAAERIELEKRIRNSGKERQAAERKRDGDQDKLKEPRADTPTPKPRRQLPPLPDGVRHDQSAKLISTKPTKPRLLPGPMFNTAILAVDKDIKCIDQVKVANDVELEIPDETDTTKYAETANSEANQYTPTIKRVATPKIIKVAEKATPEMDKTGFIREVSAVRLRERLAKKMNFDYDSFSRTAPDTKKQLELKAKQKRKIQLKNAKLAEELAQRRQKTDLASTVEGERPRSRVSFNENVVVFQTI